MADEWVISDDDRLSLDSALPAMIEGHRRLSDMIESLEDGWVRVMFQVANGQVVKSTVEQHTAYQGSRTRHAVDPPRNPG